MKTKTIARISLVAFWIVTAAHLCVTFAASVSVLGAWITGGVILALFGYGVLLGMANDMALSVKQAKAILYSAYVILGAVNLGAVALLWIAFGATVAIAATVAYYAALGVNTYLQHKHAAYVENQLSSLRGATENWV